MELLRHEALSAGLDGLNDLIRSSEDIHVVMDSVLAEATSCLDVEAAIVQVATPSPECPECWAVGFSGPSPPVLDVSVLTDGASEILVVPDAAQHDDARLPIVSFGFRALLAAPLCTKGDAFGVLAFLARDVRSFPPAEIDFVRRLGVSMSLALENARLRETERQAERQASQQLEMTGLLLDASARLAALTDLPELLDSLAEVVVRSVSRSRLLIYLYDESRRELELAAVRGDPAPPIGTVVPLGSAVAYARQAVESKHTVIGDLRDLPEGERGLPGAMGAFVILACPLVYHDQVVGLIGLDDPNQVQRLFDEREQRVVEGIAAQAAGAVENARLYESERRAARVEGTLARVNELLLTTLEPEQLMETIVSEVSLAAGSDSCLVLQPTADEWRVAYSYNMPHLPTGKTFGRGEMPAAEQVERTGEPLLVENTRTSPTLNPALIDQFKLGAFMMTPLIVRGGLVGLLDLGFVNARRFDASDAAFIERLGTVLSLALNNARLYEEQQRTREVLEQSLRAVRTNEERFRATFEQAAVGMALVRPDGRWFQINERLAEIVGYTHDDMLLLTFQEITYPPDLPEDLRQLDRVRRNEIEGFSLEKRYIRKDESLVWVNLTVSAVRSRESGVEYFVVVVEDIDERKRAEAELLESKRLSDALNDIDSAINSTLEFAQIMRRVVRATAEALSADSAVIFLREGDGWVARYVFGLPRQFVGQQFALDEIRHGATHETGRGSVIIEDAEHDPRANPELVLRYGVRSILDVPLTEGDAVVGDFALHYHDEVKHFTEGDADFANKVAASVSLALRNARRFSDERLIADTLQHALLTVPTELPGIRFGRLYRSAATAADVGGDFYDLFEVADGMIGILLGDVSGKGLQAATLTALVRNTIRAYAYDAADAATVVGKTNDVVAHGTASGSFVTLVFALLDTQNGLLTYCSAGHPAPVVKRTDGTTLLLEAHSALLGAFSGIEYCQAEVTLEPGDILVAFTDGATEARRGGELFGEARVAAAIARLPVSAVDLPQALYERIVEYAGGGLSDDLAIIAVERTP